jgi:hypothetical protein
MTRLAAPCQTAARSPTASMSPRLPTRARAEQHGCAFSKSPSWTLPALHHTAFLFHVGFLVYIQDVHVGPASPSAAAAASAAASGLDPNRITIVALLNMADYTTHTHTSVPFDQPLFDPVPRRVEYSQYKPFETYTTIITLRNKDNVCPHAVHFSVSRMLYRELHCRLQCCFCSDFFLCACSILAASRLPRPTRPSSH